MQYLNRVIKCIADATRYPIEILAPELDLENDLGIDSVKRLEITLAVGEAFNIPAERQTRESWVKTIQDVADWVAQIAPQVIESSTGNLSASAIVPTVAPIDRFASATHPAVPASSTCRIDVATPFPLPHATRTASNAPTACDVTGNPEGAKATSAPPPVANAGGASFRDKVAFVTGAGHGVGNVIARLLAQQGITVIVNTFHSRAKGEQTVHEIRRAGGNAEHIWGSVANPVHVESMFDQIASLFGKLDYLVCNASDGKIGAFLDLTSEDWDRAFRTNVSGHYQCAIRASGLMRNAGEGRIVTLSSVGSHSYIRGLGSQGVVKAAVETLTRYLACELGPMRIRVNCVAGGPVYGDLLSKFPDAESAQRHWEAMTPNGQLSSSSDLANTVLFLLGDSARGINGSVIQVDQGFSAVADGRSSRAPISQSNASMPYCHSATSN